MLSVTKYPQEYVDTCRSRIASRMSAYRDLVAGAPDARDAAAAFEPLFFETMVLALEQSFCHRARGAEGEDGNPLNEVRVLCSSLLLHGGTMTAEKSIKLDPGKSLLKLDVGDTIVIGEDDFLALSTAFLAEIEHRYT